MWLPNLVLLLAVAGGSLAHKEPKTPEEIEVQRNLQAAAAECAPAVESFTADRKRAFKERARALIGGIPALGYQDLFSASSYADLKKAISSSEDPEDEHQAIFNSCSTISETHAQNNTCVLAPEVTEGPYYHLEGHPIRQNIAELQDGLLLLLDIGVIDVETCKPLPNVLVDIWQANATGSYSGHPVPHPHLMNEQPQVGGKRSGLLSAYPRTVHEETWLRGAWPTNENGVAHFTTIFPGYYTGRATHVHAKIFPEWAPLPNGTYKAGRLSHVGQFFFEDDINLVIDNMHPYTENPIRHTRGRTRNWRDSLNIFEDSHAPEGKYNPIFRLEFLGGVIRQGLIGYITMAVNASASYDNFWKG